MKYGFVFTNYNNSSFTRAAVQSIEAGHGASDCIVVVVDNSSQTSDVEQLNNIKNDFPRLHLILNPENLGYFRGLNVGIEYIRSRYNDVQFIVCGNNDLVFPADFTDRVSAKRTFLETHAVIAPDLVTLDNVHQNPHVTDRISKGRMFVWDLYYSNYALAIVIRFLARLTRRFTARTDSNQHMVGRAISQGYGACYILTPLFFKNFKRLWAPTFLMGEEFFLSKQLDSRSLKTYYEPSIIVNHHDHATLNKLPSKRLWQLSRESHKVYQRYMDRNLATDQDFLQHAGINERNK
jgi:GT2 family glycosyltransferase